MKTFTRSGTAKWQGSGLEGAGGISTQSGAFSNQPFSYLSRFKSEDGRAGTNPEELIAGALAGCFTMALATTLTKMGHEPEWLEAKAVLTAQAPDADWTLTTVKLEVIGRMPDIGLETLRKTAEQTLRTCPVGKALAMEKSVEVKLA